MPSKDFQKLKELLATTEPPELGPGPRTGVTSLAALNQSLAARLPETSSDAPAAALARAVVMLWHDHLEAAHRIAQDIETSDGSYVHAIMHRREPDYGNSKYWFRRVGRHPAFAELARRSAAWLEAQEGRSLASKLVPRGEWDPFAFVDACEVAAGRPGSDSQLRVLRAIQALELEILLEYLCAR
jgi:hypothetical protein